MAEFSTGSEFAGHRLEGIAGRGGMGVVYRATHLALDRIVALKLVTPEYAADPEFRERFQRESKMAASLDHPNVLPIYHAGEAEGQLFITMRFVEGTDLRAMIAGQGRLDPQVAADVVSQVGAALDAAHARGLVHRDVKPANVLLSSTREGNQHAYLTDFGLTKQSASTGGLTKTGMWVGTLDYVAPEQIQGASVDGRADVYALAAVLYQAVTGKVPYEKDSDVAKLWAHINDPPPAASEAVPSLPKELDEVVKRGMASDPEDRYLSAGDLGRAALAAAEGRTVSRAERSVATGAAAPVEADSVPPRAEPTATGAVAQPAEPTAEAATPTEPPRVPPTGAEGAPGVPARPPGPVPPAGPAGPPEAAKRRRRLLIGAGAGGALVLLLAVLAVAGVFGGGGKSKSTHHGANASSNGGGGSSGGTNSGGGTGITTPTSTGDPVSSVSSCLSQNGFKVQPQKVTSKDTNLLGKTAQLNAETASNLYFIGFFKSPSDANFYAKPTPGIQLKYKAYGSITVGYDHPNAEVDKVVGCVQSANGTSSASGGDPVTTVSNCLRQNGFNRLEPQKVTASDTNTLGKTAQINVNTPSDLYFVAFFKSPSDANFYAKPTPGIQLKYKAYGSITVGYDHPTADLTQIVSCVQSV